MGRGSRGVADVAQRLEASKDVVDLFEIRCRQVVLLARRGQQAAVRELLAWIGEQDATQMSAYIQTYALLGKALVHLLSPDLRQARAVLRE